MEENTQLPKEVVEQIKTNAALRCDRDNGKDDNSFRNGYYSGYVSGATAYATKLHQATETIKVLEYDNNKLKGQVEGLQEAHDDHKHLVRHLDILINGDAAAEQASLCDLVKQIESFGLPAVNNPNYKGGADWVKCWEQKPDTHKVRFKDKHGNDFIGNYSKDTGQYWAYGLGQAINDVIYWRPQNESAERLSNAVEELKAQPGARWVKATDRVPDHEKYVHCRSGLDLLILYYDCDGKAFFNEDGDEYLIDEVEWLDESTVLTQSRADFIREANNRDLGGVATAKPTFWDVAKAFKWAAEYGNELGENLVLTEDGQWLLFKSEEGVTETDELTSGNVAELYCLQNGFEKNTDESAAGREDAVEQGAIAFADWGNKNVKGFDPIEEKWVYGEDEKRYTTAQLYTIFKQQKEK